MFYYNDMPFVDEATAKASFGTIKMYYRNNNDRLGSTSYGGDICLRYYVFMSTDYSKLSIIDNATDGSRAVAADTGDVYILCNDSWRIQPKLNDLTDEASLKWIH